MAHRYRQFYWGIILLALAARLVALPLGLNSYESRGIRFYDEYGGIAENIVEGRGFSYAWAGPLRPTSIHAPVYPYFLALVFRTVGSDRSGAIAVMLINIGVSLFLIHLLSRFLKESFGNGPALLGMLVVALYPPQIYYSVSGLPTCLYTLGLFAAVLGAWRTRLDPTLGRGGWWGLIIGMCALSYTFIVVLAPLLVVWLVVAARPVDRWRAVRAAVLAGSVAILVCVPWTIRNYQVHGHWILIRDQGGINLWWGNYENATGGAVTKDGVDLGKLPEKAERIMRTFDNEVDADRHMGSLAWEAITADPGRTAVLWLKKLGMFWWFAPDSKSGGAGLVRYLIYLKIMKAMFLATVLLGLVICFRMNRPVFLLVLCVSLALSGLHMVFHAGNIRYFFPLEPILTIPIALTLSWALGRRWEWMAPAKSEIRV